LKKLFIILVIVVIAAPGYACDKWVLSSSKPYGVNTLCNYQSLDGSGQKLSVQLPAPAGCPILLDPCSEAGPRTEIIINQGSPEPALAPDPVPFGRKVLFDEVMQEYLRRYR